MPAAATTLDRNAQRRYERALTAAYARADDATRRYGADWYADARAFADGLAERFDIPAENVACAIAALSPRCRWDENKADTERLCRWYDAERDAAQGYGHHVPLYYIRRDFYAVSIAQIEKAVDCLHTAGDALAERILRGPKERAFAANIIGDASAVTVDSWIYAAALRIDTTRGARLGRRMNPSAREYAGISLALRRVAEREGTTPRDLQAAVWIVVRGSAD